MHSGGIDGFTTHCMLLPDDGAGVVVLTNTSASAMHLVVAFRVLDELLGAEPLDVFSFLKPRFDAVMAGSREARAARRVVPDAPLPRPLDAYVGEYANPYWGPAKVTETNGALQLSIGPRGDSFPLTHWDADTFTFALQGENAPRGTISKATFASNTLTLEYFDQDKLGKFTR